MIKSYLQAPTEVPKYNRTYSYLPANDYQEERFDYSILPEEYNIFSSVENVPCTPEQQEMLNCILKDFEDALKVIYYRYNVIKSLPKLNITKDQDDAVIVNWPYSLYRIYFDIEKNIEESFYGLTVRESDSSIQSKTEVLSSKNCSNVINHILQYIFNEL